MNRTTKAFAALGIAAAAVLGGVVTGPASPAQAAGSVHVVVAGQPELVGVADPNYLTEVTVTGSGFQSIPSGFGGIYVFFGWVDGGAWGPSQGGSTGSTYRYVYDDESNPVGYQLFVSFPGSSTEYAANGGEVSAAGDWSATMKIPGSSFESYDRNGDLTTVDCLAVQCGIITIGAHGVVSPSNESFTPITFQDLYSGDAAAAAAAEAEKAAADAQAAAAAAAAGSAEDGDVVDAPAPISTTIIAAPTAASDEGNLVPILLGAVGGVGILALAAIGFLVWAVLSSRKRTALALAGAGAGAGAGAAGAGSGVSAANSAAGSSAPSSTSSGANGGDAANSGGAATPATPPATAATASSATDATPHGSSATATGADTPGATPASAPSDRRPDA